MKNKNIHNLPQCPLCDGPMRIGKAMSGPKIYCKNYAYCGGIIDIKTNGPSFGSANYKRLKK